MYIADFLHKYKKDLTNRIDDISISLTSGSASDIGHYKAMVGEIQGLSYALEHIQTLLKKVDDDSDST
jgi:hypothetical protein|tara:strand:- start:468 stop:671 length:204 start_codon:yes stop_codon:yes gene_type:complete